MSSRLRLKPRSNSRKLLIKIRISKAIPNIVGHQPDTFKIGLSGSVVNPNAYYYTISFSKYWICEPD